MKNLTKLLILFVSLTVITACNQQAPSSTIGIINLGKISDETGNAEKIKSELEKIRTRLQQELQSVQMNLQKSFQENQDKIGKTPTDEQRMQLGKMLADAQNKLKMAQTSAAIELKNKREELVIQLRDTVRPIANKIAQQRGMSIVIIKNDNLLLGYDKKVDITDAVITEMKKIGGNDTAAPEIEKAPVTEKPTEEKAAAEISAPPAVPATTEK
ncbi:MAG: OmpH family outer membrane protein [Gammaproteobacteria bacterium]|nr:OmpH family outer membrane protein [Gammaproteobacteria bacterium]